MSRFNIRGFKNLYVSGVLAMLMAFNQFTFAAAYTFDNLQGSAHASRDLVNVVQGIAGKDYVSGQIIVKYKDNVITESAVKDLGSSRVTTKSLNKNTYVVKLGPKEDLAQVVADLNNNPNVEYAEPNYRVKAFSDPNDSMYSSQWGLEKIKASQAWDLIDPSPDITIAVIDTGVDLDHPDLADSLVPGKDFIDYDGRPDDEEGHGTLVAGVAAAISNNNSGIAGVAGGVKIMPLRVMGPDGYGETSDIINAIKWAADNGADVINLSLGSPDYSKALENAINYAFNKGSVIVAATGNEDSEVSYPAAFENVIAVGASDETDNRADFSNYGPEIDVVAPGVFILSTAPNEMVNPETNLKYATFSGTSASAPFVSGVAALILSQNPDLTPTQVTAKLKESADDIGSPGVDNYTGFGRVNALKALSYNETFEPNDSLATAKSVMAAEKIYAVFNPAADQDWYKINLTGQQVKINLNVPKNIDGKIEVFDKTNKLVTTINNSGLGGAEAGFLQITTPGLYYVKVSDVSGNSSLGAYSLKINDGDIYEPNNDLSTASTLNLNQDLNAKIDTSADNDYFKVNFTQGGVAQINLKTSANMDGTIEIYGASKNLIELVDERGKGKGEAITKQILPGTYYFKVANFVNSKAGEPYTLRIDFATTDIFPPTIESSNPTINSTKEALNKNLQIIFSEDIVAGKGYSNITLTDTKRKKIPFVKTITGNKLVIDPTLTLTKQTKYILTIPVGAVKDANNNGLKTPYTLQFTTGTS